MIRCVGKKSVRRGIATLGLTLSITSLSLAVLLLLDSLLFRTGFYVTVLEPDSYAGRFVQALRQARSTPENSPKPVLVLGDSRIGEGFSAKIADGIGSGRRFINASIPGASLRTFYYTLREADPSRDRYSVVVIPVDDYDDEDGVWDRDDVLTDARIVLPALRWTDVLQFVISYRDPAARWEILRETVLKGFVYKDDIRMFLQDPAARISSVRAFQAHAMDWSYGYAGNAGNLAGLKWEAPVRRIVCPPRIPPPIQAELREVYERGPAPQTGRYKQYRQRWFRELITPYLHSATLFLILRIPGHPLPAPHYALHDPDSAVRSLRSDPRVILEDERAFEYLERPEYFFDALHMNAKGRALFSEALAEAVGKRSGRQM